MNSKKAAILVCTHKEAIVPQSDVFMPIHGGKALAGKDIGFPGDNTGDNISAKNPNYCELTTLYWAWKNLPPDVEYVGLNHYRRYFKLGWAPERTEALSAEQILTKVQPMTVADIEKFLGNNDVILAKRNVYPHTVMNDYILCHITEDFTILTNILKQKYPEYSRTYDKFMASNNKYSPYNMFIMKRHDFDNFCKWVFDILFEVEKHVRLSPYAAQRRVFGYMSERLLNVYCLHNKLKIKYTPVYFVYEKSPKEMYRMDWYCTLRNTISFWMLKGMLRHKKRCIDRESPKD